MCLRPAEPARPGPRPRHRGIGGHVGTAGLNGGARAARWAFPLLAAVQIALMMAMMVLNVALPSVGRPLDLDAERLALVCGAYPVSLCGLLLFGGRLGDTAGHRRTFVIGTAVFAAGSAWAGLATGFATMVAARFVQGAGAAPAAPAALALVGRVFPDARARRRAVAFPALPGLRPGDAPS
ncbi:MFS transporter [Streptomyces sp. MP131-18]|uniref:MFS transporter n=1 Tax=Streptomyces sp. MP131-18 TaxID=1857892 RepID=UPI00097BB4DF|nr:MFS transporter [Streptomyces sp. MP131-18]